MRKEVIIAIILGLGLGFIITFGIYRTQVALRSTPSSKQQAAALKTPLATTPTTEQDLAIRNPENGLITTAKSIVLTGETKPDAPVVLFVNNAEYLSTTDGSGNFSFDVPLSPGGNVLSVSVLLDDGSAYTDQRTVISGDFTELYQENTASSSGK